MKIELYFRLFDRKTMIIKLVTASMMKVKISYSISESHKTTTAPSVAEVVWPYALIQLHVHTLLMFP